MPHFVASQVHEIDRMWNTAFCQCTATSVVAEMWVKWNVAACSESLGPMEICDSCIVQGITL